MPNNKKKLLVLDFIDDSFILGEWFGGVLDRFDFLTTSPEEVGCVIFGGGVDVDPRIYNEKIGNFTQRPDVHRDRLETAVFNWAKKHKIPMIGVCRGAQLITALMGGKLVQHIEGHCDGDKGHPVLLPSGEEILTNSYHHQMMFPWMSTKEFRILGYTPIRQSKVYFGGSNSSVFEEWNIPEMFIRLEFVEPELVWWPDVNALCVQGHPEWMTPKDALVQHMNHLIEKLIIPHVYPAGCEARA